MKEDFIRRYEKVLKEELPSFKVLKPSLKLEIIDADIKKIIDVERREKYDSGLSNLEKEDLNNMLGKYEVKKINATARARIRIGALQVEEQQEFVKLLQEKWNKLKSHKGSLLELRHAKYLQTATSLSVYIEDEELREKIDVINTYCEELLENSIGSK